MDEPFRRPGKGMSPILSQLASAGEERRRELPREAEPMDPHERRMRLEAVFGVSAINAQGLWVGCLLAWTTMVPLCGVMTSSDGNPASIILAVVVAVGLTIWAAVASERRRLQRRVAVDQKLASMQQLPFPVNGYELWCLSERPLFDVTLSTPIDNRQFIDAVAAVDASAEVDWIDERVVRIFIPPRTAEASEQPTSWYADHEALSRLFERLLLPLHSDLHIERVDMGGAMLKR
jgi:hypothetical protein